MRKTARVNETAESHPGGARTVTADIGQKGTLVAYLLRLARLRPRKAVAGEDADDAITQQGRRPDQASDAARSAMEAGITRGTSLLFGDFGSRR